MRHVALAVTEKELPLIVELWLHFYENYVINPGYYEYLGMETQDLINFKLMILGLFVGLAVASIGIVYDKRILGDAVRKLLREECLSPDRAKTLPELGFGRSSILRHSVRKSVSLRRVVKCCEEQEFYRVQEQMRAEHEEKRKTDRSLGRFREMEYEFDLEQDHFYIPEEMKYTADVKFEKKGNSFFFVIFFVVMLAVMYIALLVFLPDILKVINDFVGGFSYQSNTVI